MSDPKLLATMDLLRDFGFRNDPAAFGDSLVIDFGNFELHAYCESGSINDTVLFTGGLVTQWPNGRISKMAWVEFEIPSQIESREQCAAWIAYHLDKSAGRGGFVPTRESGWFIEGQQNKDLLPWRVKQAASRAAYDARPRCTVGREWLRLALKSLAEQVASAGDEAPVILGFEDGVLSIWCAGKVIPLPGEGVPWPQKVTIPTGKLRHLPKRLMSERISVSVWDSCLRIDRWSYAGVVDVTDNSADEGNQ